MSSQLDLFSYTAPTTYPYTTPAPRPAPAPALVDDDPDEEAPAIVGSLSAGQLANHHYMVTCPLNCVGQTEFCHNCALFQSAKRTASGSISIECKALAYADYDGNLSPGYGLIPGHINQGGMSKIQWVKEIILTALTIRERRPREVQYKA